MVTQAYTISTVKNAVPPKVKMSQYDSASRTITFSVVDGSGSAVSLTGKTVTVEGTRIDGHAFAASCTVNGNSVSFTETADMTNQAGDHPAELVVRQDGQRLGTMNFIISVEPAAMDEDAEITEEDKSLFEQLYGVGDAALSAAETLYQYILDNASAPIIYNTASGAVASFSDGADDYPLKGLTVAVEPAQAGSGDPSPSNIRPISGRDEIEIVRAGKNLLDSENCVDNLYIVASTLKFGTLAGASVYYAYVAPNTTYTLSCDDGDRTVVVSSDSIPSNGAGFKRLIRNIGSLSVPFTFTTAADETIICFYINRYASTKPTKVQLELGSTATDYEPYQGEIYTISLGETVYGGTLDVVGGKMVVDRAMVDLGTLTWGYASGVSRYYSQSLVSAVKPGGDFVCMIYTSGNTSTTDFTLQIGTNGYIYAHNSNYTDAASFKTAMSGVQLVYELATPIEISLAPTQINTLLGVNNVYSDAGNVEVEYPADTKQFILNAIASALA